MLGQFAARGHLLTGAKPSTEDRLGYQLLNLVLQRAFRIGWQKECLFGNRHFGLKPVYVLDLIIGQICPLCLEDFPI